MQSSMGNRLPGNRMDGKNKILKDKWSEIRKCLEDGRTVLENAFEKTPEEKVEILKTRARVLAQKPAKKGPDEAHLEVVKFLLAHETYAFESIHILEVLPLKELTPLPCTPSFVLGIINFRGQIISIIDLKKFFELPEQGHTDLNRVIILHTDEPVLSNAEGMVFGILADTVVGVNAIPPSTVQPCPPTFTGIRAQYTKGITGDRVVLLDGGKILSDEKIVVNREIET